MMYMYVCMYVYMSGRIYVCMFVFTHEQECVFVCKVQKELYIYSMCQLPATFYYSIPAEYEGMKPF